MTDQIESFLADRWEGDVVPALNDYVRIPCKSPAFDPNWEANGHLDRAVEHMAEWARARSIPGIAVEVARLAGRTPVIVCDIPASAATPTFSASASASASAEDTVLVYGHLDKQPEFTGWNEGLSPWEPVRDGDRIYGRGTADDGYAIFAALTALEAAAAHSLPHNRCVVLIEASEESGSPDLAAHVDALADRLGEVTLVITLDSMVATWDRLWLTTSLRGLVSFDLRVDMLEHGVHSGASGTVASTFRILRRLLDRIEDAKSGRVLVDACHVDIPDAVRAAAVDAAAAAGAEPGLPLVPGARLTSDDPAELVLAESWRPTVSYTGADGLPALADAGNVLRPYTALHLSVRLPPTADSSAAREALAAELRRDPPYGARVELSNVEQADGWAAPPTAPWLARAAEESSRQRFGSPASYMGMGGSIPFMAMLGRRFPESQFCVTGVVGPGCTIHGPNEYLDLAQARRISATVVDLLAAHATRRG